jgi:quercetin dioxygenase-like cupin family protein
MDAMLRTRRVSHAVFGAAIAIAAGWFLSAGTTGARADGLPPGVTMAASDAFTPPSGLAAFQAMTFVLDVAPGAGFPEHSHPGRSEVMILEGDLTEHKPSGETKVYHPGDAFIEEPDAVHSVTNAGKEKVRLVWTLLLPDGKQPIVLHNH